MGNLCGKESADPFAQPGRTLSSAAAPNANNNAPKSSIPRKVGGPARTLGSNSIATAAHTDSQTEDARRKAAEAAEARAKTAGKPKGKLGSQLDEQRKQTRLGTLQAASEEERLRRDADAVAEQRAYN